MHVVIFAGLFLLGTGVFLFRDRAPQSTVDHLRKGFEKSRNAMPEFAGLYEVRVDIAGDDEDPAFKFSKNTVTTSWGGRDSVDHWICAASPDHTFVEIIENKRTKPKQLSHLDLTRTTWTKGDTQYRSNGRGHTTNFSKEDVPHFFNPVLAAVSFGGEK